MDISGWIAVLEQLARETDINAIRVYEMDCNPNDGDHYSNRNYGEFLRRAAELGIYVIVVSKMTIAAWKD